MQMRQSEALYTVNLYACCLNLALQLHAHFALHVFTAIDIPSFQICVIQKQLYTSYLNILPSYLISSK